MRFETNLQFCSGDTCHNDQETALLIQVNIRTAAYSPWFFSKIFSATRYGKKISVILNKSSDVQLKKPLIVLLVLVTGGAQSSFFALCLHATTVLPLQDSCDESREIPPSQLPIVSLGAFFVLFGWHGRPLSRHGIKLPVQPYCEQPYVIALALAINCAYNIPYG